MALPSECLPPPGGRAEQEHQVLDLRISSKDWATHSPYAVSFNPNKLLKQIFTGDETMF